MLESGGKVAAERPKIPSPRNGEAKCSSEICSYKRARGRFNDLIRTKAASLSLFFLDSQDGRRTLRGILDSKRRESSVVKDSSYSSGLGVVFIDSFREGQIRNIGQDLLDGCLISKGSTSKKGSKLKQNQHR
ncbi:hypothetical protein MRB53_035624 [Persea americana]|uniref:Uncharacterized protein n=1 Tax=Persea americana TaxID=3435 RepID=A0ACC2K5H2_PERAE|nr:hypothetical protein MRB53_035624 [Persea americana]